jgi:hypothetical protein
MGSLLDIIIANIIGGILVLLGLNYLDTTTKHFVTHGDDLIVQQNLTSITNTLEYDLRKMGFRVPEGDEVVLIADSNQIRYRGDQNKDNSIDTVDYYLGNVSELSATKNPDDRFIYRKLNGLPSNGFKVGVVSEYKFDYLDQDGVIVDTSNPQNLKLIKMIRITLKVENSAAYSSNPVPEKSEYTSAFWQQTRLVSRNLRR